MFNSLWFNKLWICVWFIKTRHKKVKNLTKKVVANSIQKEAEKELTNLSLKSNNILKK